MTEKTAEPMNTRSFGIAFALSQIGEQPALAGLGTLGVEIKRLIADSRAIVAETGTPAPHSVEDDFQHWLSYSGVGAASEADLRAAYFAGANVRPPQAEKVRDLPLVADRAQGVDCHDCEDLTPHRHI